MSTPNLFPIVCGPFLLLVILIAAIFGMRSRLKFGRRLRNVSQNREKLDNWLVTHQRKQRVLLIVSAMSILSTLALCLLMLSGILFPSKPILIVIGTLILVSIIAGTLVLIDLERLAK